MSRHEIERNLEIYKKYKVDKTHSTYRLADEYGVSRQRIATIVKETEAYIKDLNIN